jgi:type IV fimbrial biogenesis protein FimT
MAAPRHRSPRDAGFTLLEAVVVLAILALVTGFGVPAYGKYLRWYRVQSEAQALVWALQLARSEAIKRNTRVNVCKSIDRTSCSKGGGFEAGWLIYADPGGIGQPDTNDRPIRIEPAAPDGITIHGNKPVADLVSYTAYGHPRLLGGGLQMGTFTVCRPGVDAILVVLANSGRVRIENTADPC